MFLKNKKMVNKNYQKGVRKERKLVNAARQAGNLSFRSAGSHSPIDVVIIDLQAKNIRLIQCKPDNFTGTNKLYELWKHLTGTYTVTYEVI